jgi:hypothetical protein
MNRFLDVLANVILWTVLLVVGIILVLSCLEQPLVLLVVAVLCLVLWAWERTGKM